MLLHSGCSERETRPSSEQNSDAIKSAAIESVYHIAFQESMVFGSTEEHLFALRAWGSAITDEQDRVYIPDLNNIIHVFDDSGRHIAQMGGEGRGPGEFQHMADFQITPDYLYIYDKSLYKITAYSLKDLAYSHTILLDKEGWEDVKPLQKSTIGHDFFVTDEGEILMAFFSMVNLDIKTIEQDDLDKNSTIQFYWLNPKGVVISDKVLEQSRKNRVIAKIWGLKTVTNFDFLGVPLLTASSEGRIAAAQSTEFKITIYSPEGRVTKVIDFPFTKAPLTREALVEEYKNGFPGKEKALRDVDLPATRPALEKMFFDDQARLWVAAIASDLSTYKWFIFDIEGELLAHFTWARDKPIQDVNGGFMYALEKNEKEDRIIVKYEIEFEER